MSKNQKAEQEVEVVQRTETEVQVEAGQRVRREVKSFTSRTAC